MLKLIGKFLACQPATVEPPREPANVLSAYSDEFLADHLRQCTQEIFEVGNELKRRKYDVHIVFQDEPVYGYYTKSHGRLLFDSTHNYASVTTTILQSVTTVKKL